MSAPVLSNRMLERLPPAWQDGPHIGALMGVLGDELGRVEAATLALLRSRHVTLSAAWTSRELAAIEVAAGTEAASARRAAQARTELGRLGALLGLRPDPDERPRDFRDRLARFLSIHRQGLGSAEAILQLVALEYRAAWPPPIHIDPQSGRWVATLSVPAGDGKRKSLKVELEDHPQRPRQVRVLGLVEGEGGVLEQSSLEPALPELRLTARTPMHLPALTHVESDSTLLYLGNLLPGQVLVLRHRRPPELDGHPAPAPALSLRDAGRPLPQLSDRALSSVFAGVRFSPLEHGEHHFRLFRAPEAWLDQLSGLLDASSWSGDGTCFDEPNARFTADADQGPGALLGDGSAPSAELPLPPPLHSTDAASVDLDFRWIGREPGAFSVHVPATWMPPRFRDAAEWASCLHRALDYGRAAGIRAYLAADYDLAADVLPIDDALSNRVSLAMQDLSTPEDLWSASASLSLPEVSSPEDSVAFPGAYDRTDFDSSFFRLPTEVGTLGESFFGQARFQEGGIGSFGLGRFGAHRFTDAPDGIFGRSRFGDADFGARSEPRLGRLVLDETAFPALEGLGTLGDARLDLSLFARGPRGVLDLSRLDHVMFVAPKDGALFAEGVLATSGMGLDQAGLAEALPAALDSAALDTHSLANQD